jgi:DNA-binding IclR family transcriptional regulator
MSYEEAMTQLTSALRPVAILEYIAGKPEGVTLRELRDELEIPRSTVWLLTRQLEDGGFIAKSDATTFVAGARLVRMSLRLYQTANIGGDARAALQDLASATGTDVYLAIRTGDSIVYADRVFGKHSVQVRRSLGEPRSLHASAPGKLFLAYDSSGELWQQEIEGRELKQFTRFTVTDLDELRQQLVQIRQHGYVHTVSEVLMSISSLGAMAFNPDGSPWGAVVLSAHESDLEWQLETAIEQLHATTARIAELRAKFEP